MPTVEEMAQAYMSQIEQKVSSTERQLDLLRRHLQECKEEMKENDHDRSPIPTGSITDN